MKFKQIGRMITVCYWLAVFVVWQAKYDLNHHAAELMIPVSTTYSIGPPVYVEPEPPAKAPLDPAYFQRFTWGMRTI